MRNITNFILTFCLLAFALTACGDDNPEPSDNPGQAQNDGIVPVEIKIVEKRPFTITLAYKSVLAGLNESIVKSGVNDCIEKVLFKVGDKVKKGDIIIQFPENNAALQYSKAKTALDNSEKSYNRAKEQAKAGTVSQKELTAIEKQYNLSKKNYESIKQMIFVESPIDGTILEIYVKEGNKSAIGKDLFKVGDEKAVTTTVQVSESDIALVKPRMKAVMTVDGKEIEGRIASFSDTIDSKSRTYLVPAQFRNPGNTLKSGTAVDIKIITHESPAAIAIPSNCILNESGRQYVYIANNGVAEKKYIKTGQSNAMEIEVTGGINPGDSLITAGQTMVKEGVRIRIGK